MYGTSLQKLPSPAPKAGFQKIRGVIAQFLRRAWFGPSDLPAHLRMEQRFIAIRYLGLLLVLPVLPLLNLSPERLLAAYALLFFDAVYNITVQMLLRRRSGWLNHGYFTTIGDGVLALSMVMIGGGFTSSFYLVLFLTTIAAAMRFGYGPSLLVVGGYVTLDATSRIFYSAEQTGGTGDFILRSALLIITAVLAGYLQEQAKAAEAALAKQLERARSLNESTRALSASLDLDTVVHTVAEETRRLVGADEAALRLRSKVSGHITYDLSSNRNLTEVEMRAHQRTLDRVITSFDVDDELDAIQQVEADDGRQYIVVPLRSRSGISGQVVVSRATHAQPFKEAEGELLVSFIERAALAIENASLYKTIEDRSQDLKRAYADLAAAHQELLGIDEMKTSFIANVSHELRTPLTSIRSFSELLLSYSVDDVTRQEFLNIINNESERLTRLINDVLDITKIEAGQVEWQMGRHNLGDLLQTSARNFAPLMAERGLNFSLVAPTEEVSVWADQDRILQVLANLLGNALKFTQKGAIELGVTLHEKEAHIYVRDTGIGIAAADQERIFDKFHQVGDTLTDKPHGTGLGLCISRDLVAHHGGHLWVESTPGQGSTFTFSLPYAPAETLAA
jgi:signal transduction histidine kinase